MGKPLEHTIRVRRDNVDSTDEILGYLDIPVEELDRLEEGEIKRWERWMGEHRGH